MMPQLTDREKKLLQLAAFILVPLLVIRFGIYPLFTYQDELKARIAKVESETAQLESEGQRLLTIKGSGENFGGLTGQVNRVLKSIGLTERAELQTRNLKKGEGMTLKINELNLNELTQLLYRLEGLPGVGIESLDLQHSFQDPKRLQVTLALVGGS